MKESQLVMNFALYTFTVPKAGKDITLKLSRGWDKLRANQRTITRPEQRRTLRMDDSPKVVIINAQDQEVYAAILELGKTSEAQLTYFTEMDTTSKRERAASKALDAIAAFLKG